MGEQPVFLSNDVVARFLTYDDLIPRLEDIMGKFSLGSDSGVVQPVRSVIPINTHSGYVGDAHSSELIRADICVLINNDLC